MSRNRLLPWWTGNAARTVEKRLSREQRLSRLGISSREFELYGNLFLNCRRPDVYSERKHDESWPQYQWYWRVSLILRHLCGETDVAIPFADSVDQIVLDIDYKGHQTWVDVEKTARAAIHALPGEPLVYQSSRSHGMRLIWFLKKKVPCARLFEWTKTKLLENKLDVRSGICEVRLGTAPDRLPFGYYSMLLDPLTFEPYYHLTLAETLEIAQNHRRWFAVSAGLDCHDLPSTRRRHSDDFMQAIYTYLKNGLPPDVSTNECLQKLAWYGRVKHKMDNGQLRTFLKNWISQSHNGHSARINNGRIRVIFDQIDRIIAGLRASPAGHGRQIERIGLGEAELKRLLDYPGNFKVLEGAFRILSFVKAKLYLQVISNNQLTGIGGGTNKWGTVFNKTEDVPNGARNFVPYVILSKALLRSLHVPYGSNTARLTRRLQELGLLALKRKAWPDGKKARQFWVNFPFEWEEIAAPKGFDEALWATLGYEGIRRRFSRHHAERIQRQLNVRDIGCRSRDSPRKVVAKKDCLTSWST